MPQFTFNKPSSQKNGPTFTFNKAPVSASSSYTPFEGFSPSGAFLGIATSTDPYSGRPFFAYKLPGQATTTDPTRTAPGINPEIATVTPRSTFENPRMPSSASQELRFNLGATPSQELDHQMALAVGGSNALDNLKVIPTKDNQAASKLEGDLADKVAKGEISLFDAQRQEAIAKGLPPPWVDAAASAPKESSAHVIKNIFQTVGWDLYYLGGKIIDHVVETAYNPLPAAQGIVETGVLKPAAFIEGIGTGVLNAENAGLEAITGKKPVLTPNGAYGQLVQMTNSIKRTPEEQKSFDTGNFIGWLIPYSKIATGTKVGLTALDLAPRIAKYIPAISDAVGFLGTGQVLHTQDQGSRLNQLTSDAIALGLFKVGGFALRKGGLFLARALGKILPPATSDAVSTAMKPIYDDISAGTKPSFEKLDRAVTEANVALEADTGVTARDILQAHLRNPEDPSSTVISDAIQSKINQLKSEIGTGKVSRSVTEERIAALEEKLKNYQPNTKAGEVKGSIQTSRFGKVDLRQGEVPSGPSTGFGSAKIENKNLGLSNEEISNLIDTLPIKSETANRTILENNTYRVIISKDWYGEPTQPWLMNIVDKNVRKAGLEPATSRVSGERSSTELFTPPKSSKSTANVKPSSPVPSEVRPAERNASLPDQTGLQGGKPPEGPGQIESAQGGSFPEKYTTRQIVSSRIRDIKTALIEYFQNSQERVRQLVNREDLNVNDVNNPYLKSALYPGRVGTKIEEGYTIAKEITADIEKLAKGTEGKSGSIRSDVNKYLVATHAPERNECGSISFP